jgi:hypothetical protein
MSIFACIYTYLYMNMDKYIYIYAYMFFSTFVYLYIGWVPKHHLVGLDNKIFILDFFGSKKLRGSGLTVPPSRFLTAYDTNKYNTFLGYYMENSSIFDKNLVQEKADQGMIWYVFLFIHIYISLYICIYIYIHICVDVYICRYICIYK